MVEIFVDQISERLIYTLDFVFLERGLTYKLNNDFYSFENSSNLKFNYSERYFENVPHLTPSTLLFDEAIFTYALGKGVFEEEICLTFNRILDPLASIFYILSRMEEYIENRRDEHDRFLSKNSVLFQNGWLDKAMCDRWAVDFLIHLCKKNGLENNFQSHFVEIRPTFDIDNAYAYQYKEGTRKILSIVKDVINQNKERLTERKKVLNNHLKDPYDTYDYIASIQERGFKVNIFWLLGDFTKFDKNLSYKNWGQQAIIERFNIDKFIIGIHPSYKSNSYYYSIEDELNRLKSILKKEVIHSRQHFLRLNIHKTYSSLLKVGITNDYTMGYAENIGFRAGTARSFYWFDLLKNEKTNLLIHPFSYMDGTLNEYLKVSVEESKTLILKLFQELEKYGGDFMFIWHNETIGDYKKWKNWSEVLEFSLNLNKR